MLTRPFHVINGKIIRNGSPNNRQIVTGSANQDEGIVWMGCVIFLLHSTICYLICVKTPCANSSIAYKFDSRGIVLKYLRLKPDLGYSMTASSI